ncbi:hypothetical protein WA158_000404 [Blastocystis sp. Blastoise]
MSCDAESIKTPSFTWGEDKEIFYSKLVPWVKAIVENESDYVANLSNIAAAVYSAIKQSRGETGTNWYGFYIMRQNKGKSQLVLGPFNGKIASRRINLENGVCGAAARTKKTQLVKDVHKFPGHIACDSNSNSELVVPLFYNENVVGVMDMDSPLLGGWDETDQHYMEQIASIISTSCEWTNEYKPSKFCVKI